jgi:hypothetical protein
MNKPDPIIIIKDDMDGQEVRVEIFQKLGYANKVIYFSDGNKTVDFWTTPT